MARIFVVATFDHAGQAGYLSDMSDGTANLAAIAKRKLATAVRLPRRTVALAWLVWMLLWPARLIVLTVPAKMLSRAFGTDRGVNAYIPPVDEHGMARAQRLTAAFDIAVRYGPKSANCYPQALVAHSLLSVRGVGHALFFGLHRAEDGAELKAHAWVMAGELAVSGGPGREDYTVVRCFVNE